MRRGKKSHSTTPGHQDTWSSRLSDIVAATGGGLVQPSTLSPASVKEFLCIMKTSHTNTRVIDLVCQIWLPQHLPSQSRDAKLCPTNRSNVVYCDLDRFGMTTTSVVPNHSDQVSSNGINQVILPKYLTHYVTCWEENGLRTKKLWRYKIWLNIEHDDVNSFWTWTNGVALTTWRIMGFTWTN
jgi:hypothetical protein